MRKRIFVAALALAGAFLFGVVPVSAQNFTSVTGTVTDPSGIPYANGTLNAVLVPGTPGGWTLGGQPYSGRVGPVTLDSTGSFTANFGSNAAILPAGTQWQITLNSNPGGVAPPWGTGAQSFVATLTISGATQSISAALSALAPKLTVIPLPSGGGIGGTGAAGDTVYFTAPTTVAGGTVVLDMAGISGADLGAVMNNCQTQLPAAGGMCLGDNLPAAQTLSTAVTTSKAVAFHFCGQAVSELATPNLTHNNSSLLGCPGKSTVFTKAANIDQVTVAGTDNTISYIDFEGAKASFTGNGITLNAAEFAKIDHVTINAEAGNGIDNEAGFWNFYSYNNITNWGTRAIFMNGSVDYADNNYIAGDGTATNNAITCTSCESTIINSWISDTSAAHLITQTGGSSLILTGDTIQQLGGYSAIHAQTIVMTGSVLFGGGANGDAVFVTAASTISGNQINGQSGGNGVTLSAANQSQVTGNNIQLAGSTGKSAVLVTGDILGVVITGNLIQVVDGGGASPHNNGIQLLSTSGHMFNHTISNNSINGTASVDGVWFNNNANLNTNAADNKVTYTACTHTATCIKRTDTQNNANFYSQNTSDGTIYASGGSTGDVINQTVTATAFASLPTAGGGSIINCSDCTSTTPTAGSGSGAVLTRFNSVWSGGMVDSTGKATAASYTTATNCSGVGTAANPSVATCSAAAAGSFSCATNASAGTCQVNTTKVTANSQIFVQEDDSLGTRLGVTCNTNNVLPATAPLLGARSPGASFTINLGTFTTNPLCYSYYIVN